MTYWPPVSGQVHADKSQTKPKPLIDWQESWALQTLIHTTQNHNSLPVSYDSLKSCELIQNVAGTYSVVAITPQPATTSMGPHSEFQFY